MYVLVSYMCMYVSYIKQNVILKLKVTNEINKIKNVH